MTSISLDTHKYGFGPKGLSVVLFWTPTLAFYSGFHSLWNGGIYNSYSISENWSGAIIAGSWALIKRFGIEMYKAKVSNILKNMKTVKKTFKTRFPDLKLIGPNRYHIISF